MSRTLDRSTSEPEHEAGAGPDLPAPRRDPAPTPPTFTLEAVYEGDLPPLNSSGPGVGVGPKPGRNSLTSTAVAPPSSDDELLRTRLQAATGFLALTLGLLVIGRAFTTGGRLLSFQAVTVATLGAAFALLAGDLPLSSQRLRRIEFAVFGLVSVFLAARQYQGVLQWLAHNDEALLIAAVKNTLIATILLIVAYCMFIPNRWIPAAEVVLAIAAVPVVTELLIYLTHPSAFALVRQYASPARVAEDAILLLVASGLSVYGTHVINALRTEALVARQLNQYRLLKRLGTGGMGEVYLGEHRLLKRPCAVKLIRPDTASDPIELARFEREVRATARLTHPNTVEVFDYGRTDDGMFYYVMEYLRGLSLEELVQRHGPMPPGRVIYLLRQVCGALGEAHAAGLVHRDVKPANIFAAYRGGRYDVAKLLDFGLVKGPATGISGEPVDVIRAGMIRGTPLYMSPEQISGDRVLDHRADVYALGGVAYKLLTGVPPFDLESRRDVLLAHLNEPVVPLRQLRADLPDDLEQVVMRCLEKFPEGRFEDVAALDRALGACRSASAWDDAAASSWWLAHEADAFEWDSAPSTLSTPAPSEPSPTPPNASPI